MLHCSMGRHLWLALLVFVATSVTGLEVGNGGLGGSIQREGASWEGTNAEVSRRLLQTAGAAACPLEFLQQDFGDAAGACAPSSQQGATPLGSCCSKLCAVVGLGQARYANETGKLLVPGDVASSCFQDLFMGLKEVVVSNAESLLANCNITTARFTAPACGASLTTLPDFQAASNRSFPNTAVINDCFRASNISACTAARNQQVLSLAPSNPADTALLGTAQCQELATVALVANAVPGLVANGISKSFWSGDFVSIAQQPTCTVAPWEVLDFSAVARSCGPEQYHYERCCHIMIGMYALMLTYMEKNGGNDVIPEEQLDACQQSFKDQLSLNGVSPGIVDTCQIGGPYFLAPQGCYNYTFYNDAVLPTQYITQLESVCSNQTCNSDCTRTFLAVSKTLGLEAGLSPCVVYLSVKFLSAAPNMREATDRQNCILILPDALAVGMNDTALAMLNGSVTGAPKKKHSVSTTIIIVTAVAAFVILAALAAVGAWLYLRWKKREEGWSFYEQKSLSRTRSLSVGGSENYSNTQIIVYTYSELKRATCSFTQKRLLGNGGSGYVYLGYLPRSGGEVAVKEIVKGRTKAGSKEFENEVESMSRCRHRHLVSLLGICVSESHCVVVYEFMVNGSLEDHLYLPLPNAEKVQGRGEPVFLTWPVRLNIAIGTAKGLAYLHEDCKPRIIHRDVKPSNILLDKQFEAKVCDFGLAKFSDDGRTHISTGVAGTWGYLAPEYVATSQLTEKSDVYSYGVVLLTLISGRRPTEAGLPEDEVFLPEWAWIVAEQGKLRDLVDPRLAAEPEFEEHWKTMERVLRVALFCIHTVVTTRPTMRQCIAMLQGEREVPALPSRPMTLYTIGLVATGHSHTSKLRGSLTLDVVHEMPFDEGEDDYTPRTEQSDIMEAGRSFELESNR